jgi:hypothetical protein
MTECNTLAAAMIIMKFDLSFLFILLLLSDRDVRLFFSCYIKVFIVWIAMLRGL